jgi:ribosomal protein L7Ae-like RNA K-turn-binding protein
MLEAGEEPAEAAARAKDARVLLLASDAADNTARRVRHFAEEGACLWLRIPFSKEELGHAVGRLSCAIVAITDIGFAVAVVHRLAESNPEQYGEAAAKLDLKAQRAAERRAELKAHEKNVRQRRFKKAEPARPEKRTGSGNRKEGRPEGPRADAGGGKDADPREKRSSVGQPVKKHPAAKHRPFQSERKRAKTSHSYPHSRPVKKGKGSFRRGGGEES